jgi:hypothetical protein
MRTGKSSARTHWLRSRVSEMDVCSSTSRATPTSLRAGVRGRGGGGRAGGGGGVWEGNEVRIDAGGAQ